MAGFDPRAAAALEAHLFYMAELTRGGGGTVVERDGALAFRANQPPPFLINGVARVDPAAAPASVLELGRDVFGERGYELVCLAGRDDDLCAAGIAAGMKAGGGADPLQRIERRPAPAAADTAGIEVRQVTDPAQLADVIAVNQDASDIYEIFPADFFANVFASPRTAIAPHLRVYVAYEDGEPIATSEYARYRDLCYIGWVAVVQRAMRRGLGHWITAHAVNAGFDDGVSAAVLLASPMGAPLYRRMGFTDIGELSNVYAPGTG